MSVLKMIWEIVTFDDFRRSSNWLSFVISTLILLCVLMAACYVGFVFCWIGYTLYRLVAYDYTTEVYSAVVTKRKHKPEEIKYVYYSPTRTYIPQMYSAEYNVHFLTRNGLRDVINDKKLYHDVRKGSKIRVTMKVGRNRSEEPEIKYWRVTHYSW